MNLSVGHPANYFQHNYEHFLQGAVTKHWKNKSLSMIVSRD